MECKYKRIAVKIGSNVLTRKDGTLDVTRMSALVDQVAELHRAGVEIVLVSSGAVASGRSEVKPLRKLDSVDSRQLFSAVGQAKWNYGRSGAYHKGKFLHKTTLSQSAQLYAGDAGQ